MALQEPGGQTNLPPKRTINDALIDRGFRDSAREAKLFLHPLTWVIFNLPGDRQRGLMAWFAHVATAWQIMNRRETPKITEESTDALRMELDDAFAGQCTHPRTAALVDTVRRFQIPKQFVFDVLHGADFAFRFPQPDHFDQLTPTLAKLGGGTACGALQILGAKPGFEVPAIRLGQALLLSHWLIQLPHDLLNARFRLARQDFIDCGLKANELSSNTSEKSLGFFTRLYGQRIERLFHDTRPLGDLLDFDALRSVTALVDVVWEMVIQLMLEPERLLDSRPLVSRFPHTRRHRWKFILGLPATQPFISTKHVDHH